MTHGSRDRNYLQRNKDRHAALLHMHKQTLNMDAKRTARMMMAVPKATWREYKRLHELFEGIRAGTLTAQRAVELAGGMDPRAAVARFLELRVTIGGVMAKVRDVERRNGYDRSGKGPGDPGHRQA